MTEIVTQFDYAALNYRDRAFLEEKTQEIHGAIHRTTREIADVGKLLIAVKERIGHGQFGVWLRAEFAWTHQTACNFMNVAKNIGQNSNSLNFGARTLYLLAADSTPGEVREEVIAEVKSGKKITHAEVKLRVDASRPPKRSPTSEATSPELSPHPAPAPESNDVDLSPEPEPQESPAATPMIPVAGYQGDDGSKTGRLAIERGLRKIELLFHTFINRRPEKGDVSTARTLRQIIDRLQQMLDDLERK